MRAPETKKPTNGEGANQPPNVGPDTHEMERVMSKNMTPASGNGNGPGEPVAYKGVRVMLTERLAAEFGTDPVRIQQNFSANRGRFVEGVHFFKVVGAELKALKSHFAENEVAQIDKFAAHIYLWTERGALNHAKILETDEAWQVYERLVDTYFAVKEGRAAPAIDVRNPAHLLQIATQLIEVNKELEQRAVAAEQAVEAVQPVIQAYDRIAKSEGSLCLTDAAKDLQVRPKDLFAFMRQNGWIYHRPGKAGDIAYQDKIQQGYLEHKVTVVTRADGTEKTVEQVRATPKGLARLAMVVPGARGANGNHPAAE